MSGRGMLIFISDIHLTDSLKGSSVDRSAAFARFWTRIEAARGEQPAHLVFVGDVFDIVRSPRWLDAGHRPYHDPDGAVQKVVEEIVRGILDREAGFTAAIRSQVQAGKLEIDYILGNHDRLLAAAPRARRWIWKAFTGEDREVEFPSELVFPEHSVLAFHGHKNDFICHEPDDGAPIGDAIGSDLIVRFPRAVRDALGEPLEEMDDIDDVRPIFAVPAWVRHFAAQRKGILRPVAKVWRDTVDEFLENPFTKEWLRTRDKGLLNEGRKLQLLLQLSTGRIMKKTSDQRLVRIYKYFQHAFDGRFAARGAEALQRKEYKGLHFVVNGHSHFASMVPLGQIDGRPACYFNTGTWRTVHQMGRLLDGRPAFIPYDSMSYLVFFPHDDPMGRDYEWWTGALVPRPAPGDKAAAVD